MWEVSQKRVLDLAGRLHMPVTKFECAPASSDDGSVDEYAFLWMEEGLHVLSQDEACRSGDSDYCRPKGVEQCEEAAATCCY